MAAVGYTPPVKFMPTRICVTPGSLEAMNGADSRFASGAAWASATWPVANLAILFPFVLDVTTTFASLFVNNGAAVSGNFDIGVYNNGNGTSTVTRLVSTGSTAQSGTNVPQSVASAFTLQPGNYYAALCVDNTTATVFAKTASSASTLAGFGFAQVANGAVTLPSTLTLALMAQTYTPHFGLSQKASV